jgi:membrane protease YdiL (CAAX protease family)
MIPERNGEGVGMELTTTTPAGKLAARRSVFRDVPWRWGDVLVGIVPLLAARVVLAVLARTDPASLPAVPHWAWIPPSILALAWMLIYPLRVMKLRGFTLPPLPRLRAVFIEALLALLVLPLLMVSVSVVFQAMTTVLGPASGPNAPLEPLARSPHRSDLFTMVGLAVLAAPVAEEVFFRGLLYNALSRWLAWPLAACLQAVAFGLVHPFDLVHSTAAALLGFGLALVYQWRKTLLTPMLLHALINVVSMAVMISAIAADANAPRLGVLGEPHKGGCRITRVMPGSAADVAGLRVGDVVTALDGEPVADTPSMARVVRSRRVGDKVTVEFTRGGEAHRAFAVLRARQE